METLIKKYISNWTKNVKSLCSYLHTEKMHDVEDCLSESILRIIKNKEVFKSYSHLERSLTLRTKHRFVDELRKINSRIMLTTEFNHDLSDNNSVFESIDDLKLKIKRIPKRNNRKYMIMRCMGFSYNEISERLNVNSNTLRFSVYRSKKLIKQMK